MNRSVMMSLVFSLFFLLQFGFSLAQYNQQQEATVQNTCPQNNCFGAQAGAALAYVYPCQRVPCISCEECQKICSSMQGQDGKITCRSAVYDSTFRSCDIFGTDRSEFPLVCYPSRTYFQPITSAQSQTCANGDKTPTPAPSSDVNCPEGTCVKFINVPGNALQSANSVSVPGVSLDQCINACRNNQHPQGRGQLPCASFNYGNNECRISQETAAPKGTEPLKPADNTGYFEKICLPADAVSDCGDIILRVPRYVVVGFARAVVDAASFAQCLSNCLNSQQLVQFKCNSGMYYNEDDGKKNCILNSETKDTKPDLFVPDSANKVEYFQFSCGGAAPLKPMTALATSGPKRLSDAADIEDILASHPEIQEKLGTYTEWSPCDVETRERTRFKLCISSNILNCPSETEPCEFHSASSVNETKPIASEISNDLSQEEMAKFSSAEMAGMSGEMAQEAPKAVTTRGPGAKGKGHTMGSGSNGASSGTRILTGLEEVCRCSYDTCRNTIRCDLGIMETSDGRRVWCTDVNHQLPPVKHCEQPVLRKF